MVSSLLGQCILSFTKGYYISLHSHSHLNIMLSILVLYYQYINIIPYFRFSKIKKMDYFLERDHKMRTQNVFLIYLTLRVLKAFLLLLNI